MESRFILLQDASLKLRSRHIQDATWDMSLFAFIVENLPNVDTSAIAEDHLFRGAYFWHSQRGLPGGLVKEFFKRSDGGTPPKQGQKRWYVWRW